MPRAALGLTENGIVRRLDSRTVTVIRPGRLGGVAGELVVPEDLADRLRLVTGDVVEGAVETVETPDGAVERLADVQRVNGLPVEEADDRPHARSRRSQYERASPDGWLRAAVGPDDVTGRFVDFAAPLGFGCMGVVMGSHGSGLSRIVQALLRGAVDYSPDCVPILLLLRARSEEVTEWRRRFPGVEVMVCSSVSGGGGSEETLLVADLALEAAQRQTEMGRDVLLLVDSLTGLWGAMLEVEQADAQAEADLSLARRRVNDWVERAGCFRGKSLLGGALGGSLTIVGTVWDRPIDEDVEEDRELHPHLRLVEHITTLISWRVSLTDVLAHRRLYPAVDVGRCTSRHEEAFMPADLMQRLWAARAALPADNPLECYKLVTEGIEATEDLAGLAAHLAGDEGAKGPEARAQELRSLWDRLAGDE